LTIFYTSLSTTTDCSNRWYHQTLSTSSTWMQSLPNTCLCSLMIDFEKALKGYAKFTYLLLPQFMQQQLFGNLFLGWPGWASTGKSDTTIILFNDKGSPLSLQWMVCSCPRNCILYNKETCPLRKEN